MKTFIRKSVIVASLIIATATSLYQAKAQTNRLVYDKTTNTSIGITVANAVGADYSIKNEKGNIVLQGKVKSDKTFYIPTVKLNAGSYRFFIGTLAIREFDVK